MIISPLTFIKQTDNSIVLHNNALNLGYKSLSYYLDKDKENIMQTSFAGSPVLEIKNLVSGRYILTLKNDSTRKEYTTAFFVTGEKKHIAAERIIGYIKKPVDEDIIRTMATTDIENLYSAESVTEFYYEKSRLLESMSETEEKCIYQLLYATERMENITTLKRNHLISRLSISYSPLFSMKMGGLVTRLDIFSVKGGIKKFCQQIEPEAFQTVELNLPQNNLYYIELMNGNEFLGRIIYHRYSDKIAKWLYENEEIETADIDKTIVDDILLKYENINFSDEEKEQLITEKNIEVKNWIASSPIVREVSNSSEKINLNIPEYELLKALGKNFYLAASDSDIFMFFSCYPWKKIMDSNVLFDLASPDISRDIVFSVQDEDGVVVSNYTRYNIDSAEYESKKQELERLEYTESLIKWVSPLISNQTLKDNLISDLTVIQQTVTGSKQNVFDAIILKVSSTNNYIKERNKIIVAILTHWFSQFDIIKNFAIPDRSIAFYTSIQRLSFGPREVPYALAVYKWNYGDEKIEKKYYASSDKKATFIYTDSHDYMLAFLVDSATYNRSGFVFLSNVIGEQCMLSDEFKIEVNATDE